MHRIKVLALIICALSLAVFAGCATAPPQSPLQIHRSQGNAAMANRHYAKAVQEYEKAYQMGGSNLTTLDSCHLCEAYLRSGQRDKARQACARALSVGVSWRPCRSATGSPNTWQLSWQLGLKEEVLRSIKDRVQKWPHTPSPYYYLAYFSEKAGRYDEAIAAVKKFVELGGQLMTAKGGGFVLDKPVAETFLILGKSFTGKGDFAKAINAYQKSIQNDPTIFNVAWDAYLHWADIYTYLGRYQAGIKLLKEGTARNHPVVRHRLADLYLRTGQFAEAVKALDGALDTTTYVGAGFISQKDGDLFVVAELIEGPAKKAGLQVGDKIIKVAGASVEGWSDSKLTQKTRGAEGAPVVLTVQRGGATLDITVIRGRVYQYKQVAQFVGLRSLAYRALGDKDKAAQDAELAHALYPEQKDAIQAYAALSIDRKQPDQALKVLAKADPHNNFAKLLRATAYAQAGRYQEAVATFDAITEFYLLEQSVFREKCLQTLYAALRPYVNQKKESAGRLAASGDPGGALREYGGALRLSGAAEAQEIKGRAAALLRVNPQMANTLSEDARRHVLRAEVLVKEGRFAQATKEYFGALRLAPFMARLYYNTALVFAQMKVYSPAIKLMNTYLELAPNAPNSRQVKDEIYKWKFMLERSGQ